MITNSGIEAGLPPNIFGTNTSYAQSSSYAHTGSKSMSVVATTPNTYGVSIGSLTLSSNAQYIFKAWVYSPVAVTYQPYGVLYRKMLSVGLIVCGIVIFNL